jgi:hypothetical protein
MGCTIGFLAVPLFATVLATPLKSQIIRGIVLDDSTSRPIAGAEVILRDSLDQTFWMEVTDFDGRFGMRAPTGIYTFQVLRMGYQPVYTEPFEVTVDAGDIDLTITLPNAPVVLDRVVVEAEEQPFAPGPLEGFYARKRRGWGIQLDREAIEAKVPVQFTDILRGLAGVRVYGLGGNRTMVVMTGQAPRLPSSPSNVSPGRKLEFKDNQGVSATDAQCPISYWLDGIPFTPGPLGLDEILVSEIEAVEVYRRASETPAEFLDSRSRCGVIVIWTKRGP